MFLRWSTPGAEAPSDGVAATASRSVLVVLRHLNGLLRTAGSERVAARYRTWGSLCFSTARDSDLANRAPTGKACRQPSEKGPGQDSELHSAIPFEGLILVDSRTASLRSDCPPAVAFRSNHLRGIDGDGLHCKHPNAPRRAHARVANHPPQNAPRRLLPADFRAFLHRRVRDADRRCRSTDARSFHGLMSPSRPNFSSLVHVVSHGPDPATG